MRVRFSSVAYVRRRVRTQREVRSRPRMRLFARPGELPADERTAVSVNLPRAVGASGAPPRNIREAKRLPIFDGLRGVCAVLLLVVHVGWTAAFIGSYTDPPKNLPVAMVITSFQIAVGVFFLLSGLFLYRPFARAIIAGTRRPEVGPYLLRRVLRMLPVYYLVVLAAVLLLNLNNVDGPWFVLRPLVLMQNYDPVFMAGLDITWTVSSELQWYLLLPVFAWATAVWARRSDDPMVRARRLMLPVPILILASLVWTIYIHQPSMGPFPNQFWWPIGVAANIGVGMAMAIWAARSEIVPDRLPWLFRAAARFPKSFWVAALGAFAINAFKPFGRAGYGDYDEQASALVFLGLFVCFCVLVVAPLIAPGARSRTMQVVLGNPVVVYLGRISYGIYLWHFVVMNLYLRNGNVFGQFKTLPELRGTVGFWELEIAVLVITVIVASLTYYLLERPIMNWGERRLAQRAARRAGTAVAAAEPSTLRAAA